VIGSSISAGRAKVAPALLPSRKAHLTVTLPYHQKETSIMATKKSTGKAAKKGAAKKGGAKKGAAKKSAAKKSAAPRPKMSAETKRQLAKGRKLSIQVKRGASFDALVRELGRRLVIDDRIIGPKGCAPCHSGLDFIIVGEEVVIPG
jgi:hypothetical protein